MSIESRSSLTPEVLLSDTFEELLADYEKKAATHEKILRDLEETQTILEKLNKQIIDEGYKGYRLPDNMRNTIDQILKRQNRLYGAMLHVDKELTQLSETLNAVFVTTKVGIPKPAEA